MTRGFKGTTALVALAAAAWSHAAAAESLQVTIYNQDFALVKESRTLVLKQGENEARFSDVTSLLEPDSVVLRDPRNTGGLRILEQNYEGDPLSEGSLLRRYEGKTVAFHRVNPATGEIVMTKGRLIRSGYQDGGGWNQRPGRQPFGIATASLSPIVEVDGKVQFFLPGQPVFEPLAPDAILRPTLLWKLWSDKAGSRDVEVSYLTGGLRWEATYNLVAPEKGDRFDLVGWVTLENESGAAFQNARVKLMAGDVSKVQPGTDMLARSKVMMMEADMAPAVTEKAFDEYHRCTYCRFQRRHSQFHCNRCLFLSS